jgi:tRNA nucleotidyltransferase/poly(A) polymerase
MKFDFPPMILVILERLSMAGFTAYVVGGAIRDILMNIEPKDYDITTNALPSQIVSLFNGDQDFMVSDIDAKSYHVVSVNGVEIATFRKDIYKNGNLEKTIPVKSLEVDLSRRDFTINAMAVGLDGLLIDAFNGYQDLVTRRVKFVGEPFDRMKEDPNRIIRAARMCAKIKGIMPGSNIREMMNLVDDLVPIIAKERIRLEIIKAMDCEKPSKFFRALADIDALKYILPSLDQTLDVVGGKQHREGVFDHCMMTGDHIKREFKAKSKSNPMLPLAGYLHDIGKKDPVFKNGEIHFYGHEKTGPEFAKDELSELRFTKDEINYIYGMIRCHMQGGIKMSPKSTRKLLKKLREYDIDYKDWIALRVADRASNLAKEPYTQRKINKMYSKFDRELNPQNGNLKATLDVRDLAISGTTIQELLNIGPSQLVGVILQYLLDRVLIDPNLNTPEELTKLIIGVKPRPKPTE